MSLNPKERLIIFTRYPEAGATKTRLIPVIGAGGAAHLHRKMTENTLFQAKKTAASRGVTIEVRYDGGDERRMKGWLGTECAYQPQGAGDLGLRMQRSFEDAFGSGSDAAVLIGTDIPEMTDAVIENAFNALKQNPMVLGPAKDGGYYLIGLHRRSLSRPISDLFSGIAWGAENVLDKTLQAAKALRISCFLIDVLDDVDRPEDLGIWNRTQVPGRRKNLSHRISVIIPTINEADHIAKTLTHVASEDIREIILVDGGSDDHTVPLARSLGAKVVYGSPPRARQMNLGADIATGDVLLFLHADTLLPKNFNEHILNGLNRPGISAGAFQLRIDSQMPALRRIERLANWRSKRLGMPYGDQAIFVLSGRFHQAGGFPDIPIMEDVELIRRLKRRGKIIILPESVSTSPRRWENLGVLKTTLINQMVIMAYLAGISPDVIAPWYRRGKGLR